MRRRLACALLLAPLGGCGLHPLYGGGMSGPTAQGLARVEVEPIAGRAGWLMRNAINARLDSAGERQPARYRLIVDLDDKLVGLGISTQNTVTRERRTLRARFRLVTNDAASTTLLDASAGSDAGIDVVSSDYATLAAEQTALENLTADVADQIVARVAIFTRRSKGD